MTVFTKNAILNASNGLRVLCAAILLMSGMVFAEDKGLDGAVIAADSATLETPNETGEGAQSTARRLEVGMSLEDALELVGKDPDSETEIGAACGMLDVLTWDDDGTRLISVDGTVTSIYEGNNQESQ